MAGQKGEVAQLTRDGPEQECAEFLAASTVLEEYPREGIVSMGWNFRERGVLYVHDVPALAALLDVREDFFHADPRTFTDDEGTLTAPWPTTLATARRMAKLHADRPESVEPQVALSWLSTSH